MQKVKVCGKIASGFLIYSLSSSIFHYFGGYFRMRNLSYFRRLFSRYSYRSPGRPSGGLGCAVSVFFCTYSTSLVACYCVISILILLVLV